MARSFWYVRILRQGSPESAFASLYRPSTTSGDATELARAEQGSDPDLRLGEDTRSSTSSRAVSHLAKLAIDSGILDAINQFMSHVAEAAGNQGLRSQITRVNPVARSRAIATHLRSALGQTQEVLE